MDVVYLDFAKDIDKVSHKPLLAKLQKFGTRGELLLVWKLSLPSLPKSHCFGRARPWVHSLYYLEFLRNESWDLSFPQYM